jgi:hypothetical protein
MPVQVIADSMQKAKIQRAKTGWGWGVRQNGANRAEKYRSK